jgi:hypothetical protein
MAKVTKGYTNHELSATQQKALNELLIGKTDGEAAEIAGVSRKTVNTWKNDDPVFQAELNRRKLEVWEDFLKELNLTVGDSLATIRKAIKDGDVKTARWFFDKLGFEEFMRKNVTLNKPNGATDPEQARKEKLWKKAQEMADEELRGMSPEQALSVALNIDNQLTQKFYQQLLSEVME